MLIAARADATLSIVEQAVETSTLSISLPDRSSGSIAVKSCATCKPLLLQITPSTQFLVGRSPVSYAEFVALARGGADRGLDVFYDGKERTITRLIMSDTREATPRRRR
jgi:hypothetical protein